MNRRLKARDEAWTPEHRYRVKMIYGLVVGGFLIVAGVLVGIWAVINDRITPEDWPVLGMSAGLVAFGLMASMPSIMLPVFSALLRKIPWGRANGTEITRAIPKLEDEDEE